MTIYWTPQMSVGNQVLDGDHRYLFALVNIVELCLNNPGARRHLRTAVEHLIEYAREHFAREEKLQIRVRYAKYGEHRAEHQEIMEQLESIWYRLFPDESARSNDTPDGAAGNGTQPREVSEQEAQELVELMRHWVVGHVLKTDMRMRPLLSRYPPTLL